MYELFKIAFPAVGIALIIYLSISPRMWAQPWKFFGLALLVLVLTFGFHLAIDGLARALDSLKPGKPHLIEIKSALSLIDLIVGALAGALIAVAVTNRAVRLNSSALRELQGRADEYAQQANEMKKLLAAIGPNPSSQDDIERRQAAERIFIDATMSLRDVLDEKSRLTL